jgi:hypothetical protein
LGLHLLLKRKKMSTTSATSLTQLIREHNKSQAKLREENDKRRKLAKKAMKDVSDSFALSTNEGIGQVFRNQQILENEAKIMHHQTQLFTKNSQSWIQSFQLLNVALKELGDIENWATHLQSDMEQICANVDQILMARHQQQQQK